MLWSVPMLVMPRWFFTDIMTRVEELAGPEVARQVYYDAGFMGAVKWCRVQMEAGLAGREVLEQYLNSASQRGWGQYEIAEFDPARGRARLILRNSAVALEKGRREAPACLHMTGSMAGALQAIADHAGLGIKVRGRETRCLSQGDGYCEFLVEPA